MLVVVAVVVSVKVMVVVGAVVASVVVVGVVVVVVVVNDGGSISGANISYTLNTYCLGALSGRSFVRPSVSQLVPPLVLSSVPTPYKFIVVCLSDLFFCTVTKGASAVASGH